jgi:hypothetical protein
MGLEVSTDEGTGTTQEQPQVVEPPAQTVQPPVVEPPAVAAALPGVVVAADGTVQAPVVVAPAAVAGQGQDTLAGAQAQAVVDAPGEGQQFESLAKAVQEHRQVLEGALAEKVYALNDEERVALDSDPGTAIPKLMAKLHMEITQNVLGVIAQNLPPTIHGVLAAQRRNDEAAQEFWQAWPELQKGTDAQVVQTIGAQVAKMYPNMDRKTRIQQIGQLAVMQLGRLPQAQARLMGQKPVVQQPAMAGNFAPMPFSPAVAGGAPAVAPNGAQNLFAEMAMIMEADDK